MNPQGRFRHTVAQWGQLVGEIPDHAVHLFDSFEDVSTVFQHVYDELVGSEITVLGDNMVVTTRHSLFITFPNRRNYGFVSEAGFICVYGQDHRIFSNFPQIVNNWIHRSSCSPEGKVMLTF